MRSSDTCPSPGPISRGRRCFRGSHEDQSRTSARESPVRRGYLASFSQRAAFTAGDDKWPGRQTQDTPVPRAPHSLVQTLQGSWSRGPVARHCDSTPNNSILCFGAAAGERRARAARLGFGERRVHLRSRGLPAAARCLKFPCVLPCTVAVVRAVGPSFLWQHLHFPPAVQVQEQARDPRWSSQDAPRPPGLCQRWEGSHGPGCSWQTPWGHEGGPRGEPATTCLWTGTCASASWAPTTRLLLKPI